MDQYIGEIRPFAFGKVPQDWAPCNGQTLQISEYQELYALIGTTFGGNGVSTFALPDLRGRTIISDGTGSGLSPHYLGEQGGSEHMWFSPNQLPSHTHALAAQHAIGALYCSSAAANATTPVGGTIAKNTKMEVMSRFNTETPNADMKNGSIAMSGNTDANSTTNSHPNMQPSLALNYCIALQGIWPPRD